MSSDRLLGVLPGIPFPLNSSLPSSFSRSHSGWVFPSQRSRGWLQAPPAPLHTHLTQTPLCCSLLPTNPSPKPLCTCSSPQPVLPHTPLLTSNPARALLLQTFHSTSFTPHLETLIPTVLLCSYPSYRHPAQDNLSKKETSGSFQQTPAHHARSGWSQGPRPREDTEPALLSENSPSRKPEAKTRIWWIFVKPSKPFCFHEVEMPTAWHFPQQHPTCVSDLSTLLGVAQRCEIKSQMILSPIQAPTEGSSTYHLSERAHEFSQFIWDRSVLPGSSWVHLQSLIFHIYITQESVQGQEAETTGHKNAVHHGKQGRSHGEQLFFLKSWTKQTGMRRDHSSVQLQGISPWQRQQLTPRERGKQN